MLSIVHYCEIYNPSLVVDLLKIIDHFLHIHTRTHIFIYSWFRPFPIIFKTFKRPRSKVKVGTVKHPPTTTYRSFEPRDLSKKMNQAHFGIISVKTKLCIPNVCAVNHSSTHQHLSYSGHSKLKRHYYYYYYYVLYNMRHSKSDSYYTN